MQRHQQKDTRSKKKQGNMMPLKKSMIIFKNFRVNEINKISIKELKILIHKKFSKMHIMVYNYMSSKSLMHS